MSTLTPEVAGKVADQVSDQHDSSSKVLKIDADALAKAKAKLSQGLEPGDEIGQDTNGDGTYKGKSLELGKGGRSQLLQDRITLELVNKGYPLEKAQAIAKKQCYNHGLKTYGKEKMDLWKQPKPAK